MVDTPTLIGKFDTELKSGYFVLIVRDIPSNTKVFTSIVIKTSVQERLGTAVSRPQIEGRGTLTHLETMTDLIV